MATAKEEGFDELQKELKALRADLSALVTTVKDIGVSQAENLAGTVKGAMNDVGERMKMTATEARRRGEVAAGEVEDMIAQHPLSSVAIAMGVGFIIGLLGRR